MVIHEADKIAELLSKPNSNHRIIIYYILDPNSQCQLCYFVESVMDMLQKKNDDLIIFKVRKNTPYFSQFKELYMPELKGKVTLFIVNDEGIPLICEDIFHEDDICQAFASICSCCQLNSVSKSDISKIVERKSTVLSDQNCMQDIKGPMNRNLPQSLQKDSSCENGLSTVNHSFHTIANDDGSRSSLTELHIRLPDGTRDKQSFEVDVQLQEVYNFIVTKHNIRDFDLKTYNHPNFSSEDYEKSLKDLGLTPNGVVIVVFRNVNPFNNTGTVSAMLSQTFSVLFGQISPIFLYIRRFVCDIWVMFFSTGKSSRQLQDQSGESSSGGKKRSVAGSKRSSYGNSNIHTLRRGDDSDDENNRYNGNSTQQK